MSEAPIPFSRPYRAANDETYLLQALASGHLHGDGPFTATASRLITEITGADRALLTTSCTHALELAGILLDLGPGDEVIVPSFTFSSTAAAIAIRGATPVFVDIDPVTLGLDTELAREAITPRTRAIYVVHYGGVAADVETLVRLADEHGIAVVEDNAHGLGARSHGRGLGTFGALATQSFHDTKNIQCGEGGALLINDPSLAGRAEIVREKGTNRAQFLRGQVDKYTWVDVGSSYLPSELLAAVLQAQLEAFDEIQAKRMRVWDAYAAELPSWAASVGVDLMRVPGTSSHPAHLFYLLMPSQAEQTAFISHLKARGVTATFHYVPLDSSVAGTRFGRTPRPCEVTHDISGRLVRLPLWPGMSDADVGRVLEATQSYSPARLAEIS